MQKALKKENKDTVIHVQDEMFKVENSVMSGKEILSLSKKSNSEYELYLVKGKNKDLIKSDENVSLENGMHFYVVLKEIKFG